MGEVLSFSEFIKQNKHKKEKKPKTLLTDKKKTKALRIEEDRDSKSETIEKGDYVEDRFGNVYEVDKVTTSFSEADSVDDWDQITKFKDNPKVKFIIVWAKPTKQKKLVFVTGVDDDMYTVKKAKSKKKEDEDIYTLTFRKACKLMNDDRVESFKKRWRKFVDAIRNGDIKSEKDEKIILNQLLFDFGVLDKMKEESVVKESRIYEAEDSNDDKPEKKEKEEKPKKEEKEDKKEEKSDKKEEPKKEEEKEDKKEEKSDKKEEPKEDKEKEDNKSKEKEDGRDSGKEESSKDKQDEQDKDSEESEESEESEDESSDDNESTEARRRRARERRNAEKEEWLQQVSARKTQQSYSGAYSDASEEPSNVSRAETSPRASASGSTEDSGSKESGNSKDSGKRGESKDGEKRDVPAKGEKSDFYGVKDKITLGSMTEYGSYEVDYGNKVYFVSPEEGDKEMPAYVDEQCKVKAESKHHFLKFKTEDVFGSKEYMKTATTYKEKGIYNSEQDAEEREEKADKEAKEEEKEEEKDKKKE